MILYGIPTCDTCKKAIKTLQAAGHDVTFRDGARQAAGQIRKSLKSFTNSGIG